jgi:signal transduction histidine kinase
MDKHQDLAVEFNNKSGKLIPVSISNSFIKSGSGREIRGMVWLSKDITKQRQLEEEQRKTELIRKELEEKRLNFITMSSHELRTPLTAILGYTEFLEKIYTSNYDEKTILKYLSIIKKNALRLDRLTRGMMDVSQIDGQKFKIKKEKVNFLEFLDEIFSIYKKRLKEKLTLSIPHGPSPRYLNIDSDRISQVLVNIMDNAIKNSTPEKLFVAVKLKEEEKAIKLSISDQGPGINPDDLDTIFEKFVSIPTKNSVIGSGIGLYVSRMIIKAHGGTITAESEGLDRGATFHIILPK